MNEIKVGEKLASYTTFRIGGEAGYFAECTQASELKELCQFAQSQQLPVFVLGGGSNVLIADAGFAGLVIKNGILGIAIAEETPRDVLVEVGAGVVFDTVVEWSVEHGYWGLENLSHIPGSVGATPIQNVGAYGVEIESVIEQVEVFDIETGVITQLSKAECNFEYRGSIFKSPAGKKYIVTKVWYRLSKLANPIITYRDVANVFESQSSATLTEIRQAVIDIRSQKFPDWDQVGTAGSFFKNPVITSEQYQDLQQKYPAIPGYPVIGQESVKVPLGWVLEHICQLRGYKVGRVGSYQGQALVMVADFGATADEIKNFAYAVAAKVFEKTQMHIEWEVTAVGF